MLSKAHFVGLCTQQTRLDTSNPPKCMRISRSIDSERNRTIRRFRVETHAEPIFANPTGVLLGEWLKLTRAFDTNANKITNILSKIILIAHAHLIWHH